jgi:hypothetical protein
MGVTSIKSGRLEVNLSLSGKRGGRAIWEQFYFQLFQKSGDFHGHPFVAAYIYGDNA